MTKLPVLEFEPKEYNVPVLLTSPESLKWTFSLRYWEQMDFFGLDRSESKWFVSLLYKLKDLSQKEVERFISDSTERDSWRYHNINWNQKNIPITKDQLYWVDKCYLDNPAEYPILQFQVSQALGRVVGFWDEKNVFNIILLDPLHNIQPAKSYSYKVDDCSPLTCDYSSIMHKLDVIISSKSCFEECGTLKQLSAIQARKISTNVLMHHLDDDQLQELENVMKDSEYSVTEILLLGIEVCK